MIPRDITPILLQSARHYPVVTLTGPRQSGKTTLCRALFPNLPYLSLEDPDTRRFATEDPRGFLAQYRGGAILDEFQRVPELPSWLQGLVDQDATPGRFVLTGSQQFELMARVSQSLAGRTAVLRLLPFSMRELARPTQQWLPDMAQTLLTGFYPRIHDRGLNPSQALGDYFATYVERDVRQLTAVHDLQRFERFVRLCAGRVGQVLNLTSLGNDAGVAQSTARAWLDLLQTSYIVHLLPPWFTNTTKRLMKSPKLYFHDTGLLCWLLGLREPAQVQRDPALGHLFENLVIMEALKDRLHRGETEPLYFYRDSTGNEVDLLIPHAGRMHAVEIKAGATVNPDYFRGIHHFAKAFPAAISGGQVVHGGDAGQQRSQWPVVSWRALAGEPEVAG